MYSLGFREAAVRVCDSYSLRNVARLLKISIASLSRWCRNIHPKKWERSPSLATDEIVSAISFFLKHSVCFSCTHIVEKLKSDQGISISRQLVHVIVRKRLNYTFKRTRKRGRHEPPIQIERAKRFLDAINEFEHKGKLAAIDECGFDQRCKPVYAYAPSGKQAILKYVPNTIDRKRVTMLMSIYRNTGTKKQILSHTPCNSESFASFLRSLRYPKNTGIILDNASIHKTQIVRDVARAKGYTLLFIPPYTPEVNPIELVFGSVKNAFYKLRYSPHFRDVASAVNTSLRESIKPPSVSNTFKHAKKCTENILMEDSRQIQGGSTDIKSGVPIQK